MAAPRPLFPKQQVEADNSAGVDGQGSSLAAPINALACLVGLLNAAVDSKGSLQQKGGSCVPVPLPWTWSQPMSSCLFISLLIK